MEQLTEEELRVIHTTLKYASQDDLDSNGCPFVPISMYIDNVQHLAKKALLILEKEEYYGTDNG